MNRSPSPSPVSARTRAHRVCAVVVLAAALTGIALPALAGPGCIDDSCWQMTIPFFRVNSKGDIFFVPEPNAALKNLTPSTGCKVKETNRGGWTVKALKIPKNDPERDLKYSLLLLAVQSGQIAGITLTPPPPPDAPLEPPGNCKVDQIDLDFDPLPPPPPPGS